MNARHALAAATLALAVLGASAARPAGDAAAPRSAGDAADPPPGPPAPAPAPIRGFTAEGTARQHAVEARLRAIPDPDSIRRWHQYLTAEPHPAGSARNLHLAEWMAEQWRAQGMEEVVVRRYDVLSSAPLRVAVEMVEPERYVPTLREDPIPEDRTSSHPGVSGAWLSFSASGEVTAPAVYANSGNPADYEVLRRHGIDPRGKVVIVRYSNPYSYRGFKALTAEREGAAAMIVYSDPAEDGYARGPVYPDGPWGPASHVQRGGIAYDFIVPGDPLTPGWASTPGAPRLAVEDAVSVPRIMAVPMSHRDIRPILERLGGPEAPAAWVGALPITYRLGGAARLRVATDMRTGTEAYHVVEARLRGSERPDEWVILGNHRDAWEFGGVDPSSGTAALLELTRALGVMKAGGIRPRRTLVFCSWDGEEVTLTGSTEWAEQFAGELRRKAVAYLNVDSAAGGRRLDLSTVGSLAPMIVEATRDLRDPSGVSLLDAWRTPEPGGAAPGQAGAAARPTARPSAVRRLPDEALASTMIGSGSDHTAFINFLGVPVVDMTFDGPYGVYHSMYDSHDWVVRIGDPGFLYHDLMTELWGTLALRLANAALLPLDFESYAASLRDFVRDLDAIPGAADHLDGAGLAGRTRALRSAGRRLNDRLEAALPALDAAALDRLNGRFLAFERNWVHEAGIPGRPWFRHLLYAPRYTYAAMALPGITEAAEAGDWGRAGEQAALVAAAIDRNTALLEAAIADLPGAGGGAGADGTRGTGETARDNGETGAGAAAPSGSGAPQPAALEAALRAVRDSVDGRMGIYVEEIATGETVAIDADSEYETMSVIKVPVMAEVYRRAAEGTLDLDRRVRLGAAARRLPSGVLYALDPGLRPTIRDLVTLMIIVSDNQATDVLADLVGRDAVTRTMTALGLPRTRIAFSDLDYDRAWLGALDPSWGRAGGDATIAFPFEKYPAHRVDEAFREVLEKSGVYFGLSTPRETGRLFALMARGRLVSEKDSAAMTGILERQQVNDRIPRWLGDGVRAAHKTGDGQPYVANDAGIVRIGDRAVVMAFFIGRHRGTTAEAHEAIARAAARVVHHYGGEVDPAGLR